MKHNVRVDMLFCIASVTPVDGNASRGDSDMGPTEMPDVWRTDYIDLTKLLRELKAQFPEYFVEADQETDETLVCDGKRGFIYSG